MTVSPVRRGPSIDDLLGPAEGRFFGEGFRGVVRELRGVRLDDACTSAVAAVVYSDGWSRKAGITQRPHLSTVDALVFAGRLAEAHLQLGLGLGSDEIAGSWLRRIRIRAGTRPLEDDLGAFAVSAAPGGSGPSPDGGDRVVTRLECRVGPLTVHADLDHPGPRPLRPVSPAGGVVVLPANVAHRHLLDDVVVGGGGAVTWARLRMAAGTGRAPLLESRYRPAVSPVDVFVVGLQLGQAMLYQLDDLHRDDTATLWMRTTVIETSSPWRPVPPDGPVRAQLRDVQLLTPVRKGRWRRADVVTELGGVRLRCSVAHALPGSAGVAEAAG